MGLKRTEIKGFPVIFFFPEWWCSWVIFPSFSQLKMFVISLSFCLLFFPCLSPLFGHFSSSLWLVFIIIPLVIPLVNRKTFPHPLVRKSHLYSAPLPSF